METKLYTHCLRCGRKLKIESAKSLGYGKICYAKIKVDNIRKPLFNSEVTNAKDNT